MSNDALNEFEAPSVDPRAKNAHITHLEDLMFEHGQKGMYQSVSYLEHLRNMLSDKAHDLHVSVKWDGSPSILCGINPDNNRFFVATKSAFNKTPKLNYTDKDIEQNHGTGVLSYILQQALRYLPELNIKTILQGDILFVNADLVDGVINGVSYVMFKPNTLIYAIPRDTNLAHIIQEAKIGIVFHTEYTGNNFANLTMSNWTDRGYLANTKDVWYRDASFIDDGYQVFTPLEQLSFDSMITRMKQFLTLINLGVINKFVTLEKLKVLTMRFTNDMIRSKTMHKHTVKELLIYIERRINDDIIAAKTVQSKVRRTKEKEELLGFLQHNSEQLYLIFGLWNLIVDAKYLILAKFQTKASKNNNIKTFIQDGDNFTLTNPEGFVVAMKTGNTIKLVNRLEFAYHNFNNGLDM